MKESRSEPKFFDVLNLKIQINFFGGSVQHQKFL